MADTISSWNTLYINAHLATMAGPGYGAVPSGALAVADGKIAWTGAMADLTGPADTLAEQVIDCQGKWLLPGFVDCHTHLIWAGSRAREFEMRLAGATYEEISRQGGGIFSTVRAVREASENELFEIAARRIRHFISRGITCVEIKSGYGLDIENELKMLSVAGRLNAELPVHIEATFLGAHALPPEFSGRSGEYMDLVIQEMLPRVKDQGIATAVDAFCETIAFPRDQTESLFRAAADLGFKVKLHAEQLSDSDGAGLASEFDALSCDHLEYLSEKGARAMATHGVTAVLLPGAFHMLKETQKPPMGLMRDLGIPMALATDLNPGTSPVFGMTPVLNMGCLLFGMTCEEALAGATVNGANALGLSRRKGSLEAGKDADFVVWDIDSPADLCYLMDNTPVDRVVISGRTAFKAD
ncbi:MAG: imidazolonepropionase [Desulfobacter sp.]|nr:MAG: imidazolonepropionase [Desulfobacter sp.]